MNRILTATVTTLAAITLGTAGYTVATMPASAAAVRPAAARGPHTVSCRTQLIVIAAAERGTAGAGALKAAGLPELAATARGARTLAGARFYGMALAATSDALNGCSHDMALPSWFRWAGSTSGKCITVWGQPAHKPGNTSARVCESGWAGLS
jgi:hypothetical protein